jgi:uncharacterized membrane protein
MASLGRTLEQFAARTETLSGLDGVADTLARETDSAIRAAGLKDLLSGTWLGHPFHPLATDAVIGAWTMAAVLDFSGASERGADRLVGLGIVASLPTAAAGLSDWSDMTSGGTRRMGLVHAAGNVVALSLNAASYVARKSGNRTRGRRLTAASALPLAISGFLGAHMSFARGVGVREGRAAAAARPDRT